MKIEVIDSSQQLTMLEVAWNELSSRCPSPSLYASYDYTRIAWKHYAAPADRLFVLTAYDGAALKAIAPFCITKQKMYGIPIRRIDFIAAWEGDKPTIVAPSCEEAAWNSIYLFLTREFHSWDVFNIKEQPPDSYLSNRSAFLTDGKMACQTTHDSTSYFVDLSGTWDSYYEARGHGVKKRFRRRSKMLSELPGGISIEILERPEVMGEALDRYAALEQLSWKGEAGIGLNKNASAREFYKEFSFFMAEKKRAGIYFLKAGNRDIASYINYMYGNVVYARHTTYDPEYSRLAPGIHLKAEIIRSLFNTEYGVFDEMGMDPNRGEPMFKVEWASGMHKTSQLLVLKKNMRMLPILTGKKLRAHFKTFGPHSSTNGQLPFNENS